MLFREFTIQSVENKPIIGGLILDTILEIFYTF